MKLQSNSLAALAAVVAFGLVTPLPAAAEVTEAQITALSHWVKIGAPWPKNSAVSKINDAARTHWAFQPVVDPPVISPMQNRAVASRWLMKS